MANNTIFDDVFQTIKEKMPELTIPLINEVFGTNYSSDTAIIQGKNEHQTANGKSFRDIMELISKIADYIFSDSENVRKELGEIMGGKVLELESDRLIKQGEQIGETAVTDLMQKLIRENRMDELKRIAVDVEYRRKLMQDM